MAARLNPQQTNDPAPPSKLPALQAPERIRFGLNDPCYRMPSKCPMDRCAGPRLLRKTIPDVAVTAHTGPDGGPVLVITGVDRGDTTKD
jgi:hypothetical protein